MKLMVLVPVLAVMLFLHLRKTSMLTWVLAWWAGLFLILKYGFTTPIPQSVITLYMGIVTFSLILYVSSDRNRLQSVTGPLRTFMTERRYLVALVLVVILIPSLVATSVYLSLTSPVQAPFFARTIHPATPALITVHDTEYDLAILDNPYRPLETENPAEFASRVAKGRKIYYQNCFYCHGDNMSGNGHLARGLNPIPTNFADSGTIAILQESYLFWRISQGAPGLPEEGGPWESAMPAWEKFLSEEEIWEVILFLYDLTEQRPRAREEVH